MTVMVEHRGFKLVEDEDHDEDCRKIFHTVETPEGTKHLCWTPYEGVAVDVFCRMVDLDAIEIFCTRMAAKGTSHNWDNKLARAAMEIV